MLTGGEAAFESLSLTLFIHGVDGHRVLRQRGQVLQEVAGDAAHLKLCRITGHNEVRGNIMGSSSGITSHTEVPSLL